MSLTELDKKYIASTYNRFPVEVSHGKGAILYDKNGKEYIDLGSGIGVNAFGYCDDNWCDAVKEQISQIQHTSNLYYTEPSVKLAKLLCEKTGMKKVFFSNSGAEANECAIKAARKYASKKKGDEYFTIITLKNSFHGRTLTTLAATGQDKFHELYKPLTDGFISIDAEDTDALLTAIKNHKTAAVILECIQGEGGVIPLSHEYISSVRKITEENDVLLIIDEVQTGNGRTGKLYAYMNYGITPDIVSTAKGLGGGLPLGATLLGEKVENIFDFGDHGSTFGANPVCCAAALSVLERLTDGFLDEVRKKSEFLFDFFSDRKGIESVSGMGLMVGLKTTRPAKDVILEAMENGVLLLSAKDKVRLLPPLNIDIGLLGKAAETIAKICEKEN
ncbi:MAG: acetylornithine/succinylornithine family transaminase [Firmicutes bacterium]|nr:acetylornithine/succinylornithine family transaminase [Bacillota bacterium]